MFLAYKMFSYLSLYLKILISPFSYFFWRSNNIIHIHEIIGRCHEDNLSHILTLSIRIISRTARIADIEYLIGIGQLFERSFEGGDASALVKGRNEDSFNDTVLCNASFFVKRHARHEN